MASINVEVQPLNDPPLQLPFSYFDEDGGIPENVENQTHMLLSRWHFQRNVPKNSIGINDNSFFDAALVIQQMQSMKSSLKDFAKERYWCLVKTEAIDKGLTNFNQQIVTNQDLCDALKNLPQNRENEEKVFLILYAWFRNSYKFEKEAVDDWAIKNNYIIQTGARCGRRRVKDPIMDRHGFGQIVKDARSDTIKTITRGMARDAKWKVVATNKSKQSEKNEVYHERQCISRAAKFFVVVTEDAVEPKKRGPKKKEKMPTGPFCASTLCSLIQDMRKDTLTPEDIKGCLLKSSREDVVVVQKDDTEPTEIDTPATLQELDEINCEEMFSADTDNEKESESEEDSMSPPEILPTIEDRDVGTKRKFCGCNHEDLFGESYTKLEFRSYFTEKYMSERDHPVRYCTAIKDNGGKCGVDFADAAFSITTSNPVRACQHAVKMDTECVHAICSDCYKYLSKKHISKESEGGTQGRSSRRRQNTTVDENATGLVQL